MSYPEGRFSTSTYTPENNVIFFKGWLSCSLYNNGLTSLFVKGQEVKPGGSFHFNHGTCKLVGEIKLEFREEPNKKSIATLNFVELVKDNCTH